MKSRTLSIDIHCDFHPHEWYVLPTVYLMGSRPRVWCVAAHCLCFTATIGSPV